MDVLSRVAPGIVTDFDVGLCPQGQSRGRMAGRWHRRLFCGLRKKSEAVRRRVGASGARLAGTVGRRADREGAAWLGGIEIQWRDAVEAEEGGRRIKNTEKSLQIDQERWKTPVVPGTAHPLLGIHTRKSVEPGFTFHTPRDRRALLSRLRKRTGSVATADSNTEALEQKKKL
eukprot:3075465-Rhodomonas_salina.2